MRNTDQLAVFPIWPAGVAGSDGAVQPDTEVDTPRLGGNLKIVRNVNCPTLTAHLPDPQIATGTAVIVCPGGAFHFLSIDMEGHDVARWLCERGVAVFVLKYRLVPTVADDEGFKKQIEDLGRLRDRMQEVIPLAIADGQQALRLIRQHASEWRINPDRLGIMGFSAGGVVTAGAALQYDAASRPNFAAPIYGAPWDAMTVPADAPPLFLLVANDDPIATRAIVALYSAWKEAGRSVELHVYSRGGHGFGMQRQGLPTDRWIERFGDWLAAEGFISPSRLA